MVSSSKKILTRKTFFRFALETSGMPVDEKDISGSVVVRSRVLLEKTFFYWFGRGMPARRLPARPRKSVREETRFREMATVVVAVTVESIPI